MKSIVRLALASLALAASFGTARADLFLLSGDFDSTPLGGSTPLAGGSFSGYYSVDGLPAASGQDLTISSFRVELDDPAGHAVVVLDNTNALGTVAGNPLGTGVDQLFFNSTGGGTYQLQLIFPSPFDGNGTVIPYQSGQEFPSIASDSTGFVGVASGVSVSASSVPEPASLALLALGLPAALAWRQRRRAA